MKHHCKIRFGLGRARVGHCLLSQLLVVVSTEIRDALAGERHRDNFARPSQKVSSSLGDKNNLAANLRWNLIMKGLTMVRNLYTSRVVGL